MTNTAYLELKLAWALHGSSPDKLEAPVRAKLARTADAQRRLEGLILGSQAASGVVVTPQAVAQRVAEIRQRYDTPGEYQADLARLGLDEPGLETEVARDLHIEGVLERVVSQVPAATDTDAEIYYRLHPRTFEKPEGRVARHILITYDSDTEKARAIATLNELRPKVGSEKAFADQALRHSQCPTAMEGGLVGTVTRGKLYPELDQALFTMAPGTVSEVIETEVGLHLLRCDTIHPGQPPPFAEARDRILEHLNDQRRQAEQKRWIKTLGAALSS